MTRLLLVLLFLLPAVAAGGTTPELRLLVSDPAPYAGEEVVVTLELRYRGRLPERPQVRWDESGDAVAGELPPLPPRREGPFVVESARRALRFLGPGRRTLTGGVEIGGRQLAAPPLSLRVRPLPLAGRPEGFAGAVGRAELELRGDGTGTREVAVVLRGDGALRAFPAPLLEAGGGRLLPLGEDVSGSERTFRYLFLPGAGRRGELRATLPLFDPGEGRYRVLRATLAPPPTRAPWPFLLPPLAGAAAWLLWRRRRRSLEEVVTSLLGRPPAGLCRERLAAELRRRGVPAEALRDLARLWEAEDRARFAPGDRPLPPPAALRARAAANLRKVVDKSRRIP